MLNITFGLLISRIVIKDQKGRWRQEHQDLQDMPKEVSRPVRTTISKKKKSKV